MAGSDHREASAVGRGATDRAIGCDRVLIDSIEAYRDSRDTYSFCTLPEIRRRLSPWFEQAGCFTADYPLAADVPVITFTPAPAA